MERSSLIMLRTLNFKLIYDRVLETEKNEFYFSAGGGGGLNGNSVLYRNFKGDNLLGRLFSDKDFFFKRHLSKKNYLLYTELKNLYLL